MKQTNFYTQGQRRAASILLTVWLLTSCNPNITLAAPDGEGAMVRVTSTSPCALALPPDTRPAMGTALQQRMSQEAVADKRCELLRTSLEVSPVGENSPFQARDGEKIRFAYEKGQWRAEVLSRIGNFSRQSVLPVVCSVGENVSSSIEALSRYPSWYSQRRIHVLG